MGASQGFMHTRINPSMEWESCRMGVLSSPRRSQEQTQAEPSFCDRSLCSTGLLLSDPLRAAKGCWISLTTPILSALGLLFFSFLPVRRSSNPFPTERQVCDNPTLHSLPPGPAPPKSSKAEGISCKADTLQSDFSPSRWAVSLGPLVWASREVERSWPAFIQITLLRLGRVSLSHSFSRLNNPRGL